MQGGSSLCSEIQHHQFPQAVWSISHHLSLRWRVPCSVYVTKLNMDSLAMLFIFYSFPRSPQLPISSFNFLKSKRCCACMWKWGGKQTKSAFLDPQKTFQSAAWKYVLTLMMWSWWNTKEEAESMLFPCSWRPTAITLGPSWELFCSWASTALVSQMKL